MTKASFRQTRQAMRDLGQYADRHLAGYAQEASTLFQASLRPCVFGKRKFVVFGRGRSGSTLLVRLLNQHPSVDCLGEILRRPMLWPESHARRRMALGQSQVAGFKLLSHHLETVNPHLGGQAFLRRIVDEGWLIIYLKRQDPFRHALSLIYARRRRAFNSENPLAQAHLRIAVNPDDVLSVIAASERHEAYETSVLSGLPHVKLIYETNLKDSAAQKATTDAIFRDLGIAPHDVEATLSRVTPNALSDFVANADDLIAAIRQTPYARFVDQSA